MARGHSEQRTLYAQITEAIRRRIEDGQFQPGDKLPSLSHLAAEFECSRATVREALGALRGQGLIEMRHGDGAYVRLAAVETWMEPLDAAILLGQGQIRQLTELLTALLAGIASLAARRNYLLDTAALNRTLFNLECSTESSEEAVTAELALYTMLAQSIGNPLMENALRVLQEALRSSLRSFHEAQSQTGDTAGRQFCRELLYAVTNGEDKEAREQVYRYGEKIATILADQSRRRGGS